VKEFVSIKVSSFDHAALATSLTTKAAEGWDVVGVVAVGSDIVAYLSRTRTASTGTSSAATSSAAASGAATSGAATSEPAGWAAASTNDVASAPTQAMTATAAPDPSRTTAWSTSTTSAGTSSAAASATPSVPADWYKDPSGRYEYRYWDGQKWTEHVSRAGTVYKDPPTP
jgi:hypothetical protein